MMIITYCGREMEDFLRETQAEFNNVLFVNLSSGYIEG